MAGINLFKIDFTKKDSFKEELLKLKCIGVKKVKENNQELNLELYMSPSAESKPLGWNWIMKEFGEEEKFLESTPIGIVVIHKNKEMYAITFGHAYFKVDKFCDREFAFDFAKRMEYEEIKTTTLLSPHAKRNKTVNTFIDYKELEFDSGESFSKIKLKVKNDETKIFSPSVEIGTSLKFNIKEESLKSISELLNYVEDILKNEVKNNIPLFSIVREKEKIEELENDLKLKIIEESESLNISELDIIGATEIFNRNDGEFEVSFNGFKKTISSLTLDEIEIFCKENNIEFKKNLLNIKIVSLFNGKPIRTDTVHNLIDFTNDSERCLLSKGTWYYYNDEYITYLNESISEIDCTYDSRYDFDSTLHREFLLKKYEEEKTDKKNIGKSQEEVMKSLEKVYYAEKVFNIIRSRDGFNNYDREIDSTNGSKLELMDLYNDETMYAVKIGSSSAKLCYAVDQSIASLKMYKHKKLPNMPEIKKVAVWLILERERKLPNSQNGYPDLASLNMLMLKIKLSDWKREVRASGYIPQVYINYRR